MNMLKLGTVSQSDRGFENRSNSMNTGLRVIHYANIKDRQGGIVRGMVARFTLDRLRVCVFGNAHAPDASAPVSAFPAKRLYVPVTRKVMAKFGQMGRFLSLGAGFSLLHPYKKLFHP